ncbi:MAG: methyltransferase domain-containing protein [Candidatus Aenigmatarchaeota archaeon]
MTNDSATNYDKDIHNDYDKYRKASQITIDKILDIIGKNKKVLSLGCGTGSYEAVLSNYLNVEGIDLSKEMAAKAIEKGVNAKTGDMRSLEYEDNTFDAVYAIQSFHHVAESFNLSGAERYDERLKVIKEAFRVLKKGGVLVIIQSDPEQNKAVWFWKYFSKALEKKLVIQSKIEEIKNMMETTGFKNIDSEAYADFLFRNFYDESGPLKKEFRASYSEFGYLNAREIEKGCELLKKDIETRKVSRVIEEGKEKFNRLGGNLTIVDGKKF